jgi:hypothetical protein
MTYMETFHDWHDLYFALAGVAATLAGLLFVAVSLRPKEVSNSVYLRVRAVSGLIALVGVVMTALLLLFPARYARLEVVGAGVIGVAQLLYSIPSRGHSRATRVSLWRRVAYDVFQGALVVAAGLAIADRLAELAFALVALSQLALIGLAASGAWLLINPAEEEGKLLEEALRGDAD